jgi:hypothetical protein
MHLTAPSYSAPPVVVIDRNRWSPSVGTGGRHRRNAHLVSEGERLQRELAEYGKLTRATLRSSRIITDSLPSCKLISDRAGREYPAGEHGEP